METKDRNDLGAGDWFRRRRGCNRRGSHGVLMGALVVLIGVLLLLDNLRIIRVHDIWQYWPVFLIVAGLARLLDARSIGSYIWGVVLASAGGLLLLDNLDIFRFDWGRLWPVLLIGFGLSMLVGAMERHNFLSGPAASSNPSVHHMAIFSGVKRRLESPDFKNGDMVAIFGGIEIDLRHAAILQDGPAVIDCNALFGGIEFWVPDNWSVEVKGMAIFGAFEDKTVPPRLDPNQKPQRLIITGYAMFGGVTVRN